MSIVKLLSVELLIGKFSYDVFCDTLTIYRMITSNENIEIENTKENTVLEETTETDLSSDIDAQRQTIKEKHSKIDNEYNKDPYPGTKMTKGSSINNTTYRSTQQSQYEKGFQSNNKDIDGGMYKYRDTQWVAILENTGGPRGRAIAKLGEFLKKKKAANDTLGAVTLADDLLRGWKDTELEHLTMLLNDGWDQSLGELLRCAIIL